MSYTVVVDSCCDLTRAMRAQGHFLVVPLTIHVGEQSFVDNEQLRSSKLLAAMKECPEAPHTSCPSPVDYLDAFESADGDIYVVTLSALLSGSHNAARQAARLFLEEHPQRNIHVFNSCSASAGEVLLALKLSELAQSGLSFPQVVAQADQAITEMNTLFILENLDNLKKNGRLTKVQALLTGALRIKLLMGSTPEGEICKRGQALSVRQGLTRLAEIMAADDVHRGKVLCIAHCNCPQRAEALRMLALKYCEFSKIILCHTRGISTVYANDGGIVAAY